MNKLLLACSLLLSALVVSSCTKEGMQTAQKIKHEGHEHSSVKSYYTCSMHPQVKETRPGKCPICHMNLTKVEIDKVDDVVSSSNIKLEKDIWECESEPSVTSMKADLCPLDGKPMVLRAQKKLTSKVVAKVKLRKAQLDHFRPDYFPVTKMKMTKKIRLLGSVLQSEEKESSIPARIAGRVEKVYVKSTGSFVRVGDPVVDLYSPKLITAGEEYLLARHSFKTSPNKEFKEMLSQSEERLKQWGIKPFQYESWYVEQKVPKKIKIYSPATGIVQKRNAVVGKYFKEGQNFFELSDLSDVWVEMDMYEQDSAIVKLGQSVELEFTALPGNKVKGQIDFINPVLDTLSRTLKIRTTISNESGALKPGMVADATLNVVLDNFELVVPRTAIIDTGKRKVVWTKVSNRQFQAKTILSGHESDGYVEIKEGLMEGEEVIIEGNFLLDAQAQLFGGYEDVKESDNHKHKH